MEHINSKECNLKYVGITIQVNLDTHSCTCGQFDLGHIPYPHAIAACRLTLHVTLCVVNITLSKCCCLHIQNIFIQLEV